MRNGKFSLGIIGLGPRGIHFGGKRFLEMGRCYLTCVCAVRPESVEKALRIFGPEVTGYTDVDAFLGHSDLDAVVVATNDKSHAEIALKVLKAGKDLYLEKPMAQSIEDCDRLLDAWEESRTVFTVGLEFRYSSLMQDVKRIVERGDIGRVIMASVTDNLSVGGNYYFHGPKREKDYVKSLILEMGTHSLDLANWIIGDSPRRVYASGGLDVFGGEEAEDKLCVNCEKNGTCPYNRNVDVSHVDAVTKRDTSGDWCVYSRACDVSDNSMVLVDYAHGARLCYMQCHFTPEYTREFTFVGDQGKLTAFYNNEQNFKIMVWQRFAEEPVWYFPEKAAGEHGGGDDGIIKTFCELVLAGEPCLLGVRGARDSAAIAIAAAESERTGMPVMIPEGKNYEGSAR